jgi:CspA family cold shock protein
VRRLGTVRWFKEEKGYGRITSDDGEVLFVHFGAIIMAGHRSLQAGQRVSFVWNGGIQRLRGSAVIVDLGQVAVASRFSRRH